MKRRSILFVSPGGTSIKTIRIKVISVFIVVVFIVCGFSAYFIPSEKFRLKAAEVKQMRHLSVQNQVLHQRISSTLGMIGRLKQERATLDKKKERVAALCGDLSSPQSGSHGHLAKDAASCEGTDLKAVLNRATMLESRISGAASRLVTDGRNPFERVPVCKPIPYGAIVSLGFGISLDPFTGKENLHRGIDFSAPPGTAVIATANGTVLRVEKDALWGNRVTIGHADSISTVYAHLGTVSTAQGRIVKKGAVIGSIGLSGLTTGPHVHYEIWRNGTSVDPMAFFYPTREE